MNVLLIGALLLVIGCCDKSPENLSQYNESFSLQWGLNNFGQPIKERQGIRGIDINILSAWNLTKGSSDTLIGMLDSGIDINNFEINKSIFVNQNDIGINITVFIYHKFARFINK